MAGQELIRTGYIPRPLQLDMHASLKRFNVLVCHRRFGKTVFSINEMIHQGVTNTLHNPQYAYIAPTYKQAKMIAWEYLLDYTRSLPGFEANKSELTVSIHRPGHKKNGIWIKKPDKIRYILLGADNPDALRGIYLDGTIIDEYAQCDPIIWGEIIRPTLSDRRGWAIFIGTPKGQNHFFHRKIKAEKNPSWYVKTYKASETGVIVEEELDEMRMDMDESEYSQEMECSFEAALKGSYFGKLIRNLELEGKVGDFPYDSAFPVDTFWDLGIGDSLTIWYRQTIGARYRFIDYTTVEGMSLPEITKIVKEKEYSYGRHILPWDAKARDIGTGLTRQETLRNHKLMCEVQKRQSVDDRIQATRVMLKKSEFDAIKTAKGLDCLRSYQKEYDTKLMMFKNKPKHDWASHGADSFGYSALDVRLSQFARDRGVDLPRQAESSLNDYEGSFI